MAVTCIDRLTWLLLGDRQTKKEQKKPKPMNGVGFWEVMKKQWEKENQNGK